MSAPLATYSDAHIVERGSANATQAAGEGTGDQALGLLDGEPATRPDAFYAVVYIGAPTEQLEIPATLESGPTNSATTEQAAQVVEDQASGEGGGNTGEEEVIETDAGDGLIFSTQKPVEIHDEALEGDGGDWLEQNESSAWTDPANSQNAKDGQAEQSNEGEAGTSKEGEASTSNNEQVDSWNADEASTSNNEQVDLWNADEASTNNNGGVDGAAAAGQAAYGEAEHQRKHDFTARLRGYRRPALQQVDLARPDEALGLGFHHGSDKQFGRRYEAAITACADQQAADAFTSEFPTEQDYRKHLGNNFCDRLPEGCTINVRVKPYVGGRHDQRSHIDMVISMNPPPVNGKSERFEITFAYYASNIVGEVVCDSIDDVSKLEERVSKELSTTASLDEHARCLTINCNGTGVWSSNLFGGVHHGPFDPLVTSLRGWLQGPHQIVLLLSNASPVDDQITALNTKLGPERSNDVATVYWPPSRRGAARKLRGLGTKGTGPTGLARGSRGELAKLTHTSARKSYPTLLEYLTRMATASFDEHTWAANDKPTRVDDLSARFVRLPGEKNEHVFLVVIDTFGESNLLPRMDAGDKVRLRIHALNAYRDRYEDDWTGEKFDGFLPARHQDVVLVAKRPFDRETQRFKGADPNVLNASTLADMNDRSAATAALDSTAKHAVDIKFRSDDQMWARQINTACAVQDVVEHEGGEHSSPTATLLKGNRYDQLPVIDLLADLERRPAAMEQFQHDLREEQKDVVNYLCNAPNGMALICGAAGTGKTTILLLFAAAQLLVHAIDRAEGNQPDAGTREPLSALLVTPVNANSDRLAQSARSHLARIVDDAVVARYYSHSTTKKLGRHNANTDRDALLGQTRQPFIDYQDAFRDIRDYTVQLLTIMQAKLSRAFPSDARVTYAGMMHSTAQYTLIGTGVEEPDPEHHPAALVNRLKGFFLSTDGVAAARTLVSTMTSFRQNESAVISKDDGEALGYAWARAHELLLAKCDMVVTTDQQMMRYPGVDFKWFFMDEAARAPPADGASFVWHYKCKGYIFVGDPMQSRPSVNAPMRYSPCFADQELALFTRLMMTGLPSYHMKVQHRYPDQICRVISDYFYGGFLSTDQSVASREGVLHCGRALEALFGLRAPSNVAIANVPNSRETVVSSTGSKFNSKCASTVWTIVRGLMEKHSYKAEQIMIVVQYSASAQLHDTVKQMIPGAAEVQVTTNLKSQGAEADIVIYVIDTQQSLGFAADSNRVCGGLTRPRNGLIVVYDAQALEIIGKHWQSKPVAKLLQALIASGCSRFAHRSADLPIVSEAIGLLAGRTDTEQASDFAADMEMPGQEEAGGNEEGGEEYDEESGEEYDEESGEEYDEESGEEYDEEGGEEYDEEDDEEYDEEDGEEHNEEDGDEQ